MFFKKVLPNHIYSVKGSEIAISNQTGTLLSIINDFVNECMIDGAHQLNSRPISEFFWRFFRVSTY